MPLAELLLSCYHKDKGFVDCWFVGVYLRILSRVDVNSLYRGRFLHLGSRIMFVISRFIPDIENRSLYRGVR